MQTPYAKGRMEDTLHGTHTKVSSMRPAGNPNSGGSVFDPPNKRRKTHETSLPINPGPSGPPKWTSADGQIDLTNNDADSVSRSQTDADIASDDSLNLGSGKRSNPRIANDGHATQRLKGSHRGGESSKAVDTGSEAEGIDYFPEPRWGQMMSKEKKVDVRNMVRNIESRDDGGSHPPKLNLKNGPPLPPTKPKPKVCLFFIEEGG